MSYEHLEILMHIAKNDGMFQLIDTSTSKLSNQLRVSQQTVSRKLRDMEVQGLITRQVSQKGISISLSQKSRDFLKSHHNDISSILKIKKELNGKLIKGIGEGRYYASLLQYQKQFQRKLGLKPFAGTLNLEVKKEEKLSFIDNLEPIKIDGFAAKTRTYGALVCYKIRINGIPAALVIPERARHSEDIIEVIAEPNLRSKLKLKDRDEVTLKCID